MRLTKLDYSEFQGDPREWQLRGLELGSINLLVGRNASGKSRTLNVINGLARLLSGRKKMTFPSGHWVVEFDDDGKKVEYTLVIQDTKITEEILSIADRKYLERGEGGTGMIYAQKIDKDLEFQTPVDELAAVARRDAIQHAFFEPLTNWAETVFHYPFGSTMGRDQIALVIKEQQIEFDPKNAQHVIAIFRRGEKEFPDEFAQAVKADMGALGYEVEAVGVRAPTNVTVSGHIAGEVLALYVHERGIEGDIEQTLISQGMFRAMSLIIQVNYAKMALQPSCIVVDDIGEGLDFERSCALIELVMEKANEGGIQLIMSTNDRFVMDKVPLEAWSVLDRVGNACNVRNYANSKKVFDEFKFTGLSNFDLLATDFIHECKDD